MKKFITLSILMLAFFTNAKAQDKTTMLEVHDFAGFDNGNQLSVNGSGGIISINGKSFESWIDGEPRFTIGGDGTWQTWHAGNNDNNPTYLWAPDNSTFTINGLFAGDIVTVETKGNCQINGSSVNEGEYSYTVNSDGETITINCVGNFCGIQKVTIATKHLATYVIDHQTYTFTSGGVLPDKRKAVPYMTMSFGNEGMDYAYVRYYGTENNGVKQFGSFMLTETMDDTDFLDYNTNFTDVYYEHQENWNNINGPYVLKEPVVFKGHDFSEYVPWHGTYYYFYPETNGKLYVHMHSDPVTSHNNWGNDVMFLWDKTSNDGADASSFNYNTEGFYKFGSNPQNGVRVKKNHVYFMCTTPNDPRRRNVAHLTDYTFIPDFTMTPLYKVVDHAASPTEQNPLEVSELEYTEHMDPTTLHYRVKKCLGNIESAQVKIEDGKLYFTNITYKSGDNVNKGGAVIVDVDCTDGQADFVLTVPYSAEPSDGTGNQVKTWDFYNNIIDNATVDYNQKDNNGQVYQPFVTADAPMMGKIHLGQWKNHTDDDDISSGSGLFYETQKDPGEWLNTYIDLENEKEPIFKNVYDVEGDNADMIWDTNGLIIHAHSGTTGIYNENDLPTSGFSDRYIGLMLGSKLVIPGLKANDRVVIKMGCYGNADNTVENTNAILKLTNAKDAIGTDITGDYIIGGSMPYPDETGNAKTQPHGEYHFIVANNSTSEENDFAIEVAEGTDLLKIYSITIYTNDDIVSENELLSENSKRQILNTTEYTYPDNIRLHPHYRGVNESFNYVTVEAKTGNLVDNDINPSGDPETLWYTFEVSPLPTAANPKFGIFKARHGVKTFKDDDNKDYVTDYADCMVPVGFRETKTYPYTWDFTDLKKYVSAGIDNNGVEKEVADADADLRIWNNWNLRVTPEEWEGNIFVSGGQLYGGKTMFDETRGIGITHDNTNVAKMTGDGSDLSGGLSVSDGGTYGFIVPQVNKGQAIYVHAKEVGTTHKATYHISDGSTTYDYDKNPNNEKTFTGTGTYTGTDKNGDKIFAVALSQTRDVRLSFKGYEVNKIAVSTDPKKVNLRGWTTESRDHVIDPELTAYMTGKDIETCLVTGVDYDNKTVTLQRVYSSGSSTGNYVMSALKDGDTGACIIHNKAVTSLTATDGEVKILDGGFHLFVPDMHDYYLDEEDKPAGLKTLTENTPSMLIAQVSNTDGKKLIPASKGDYTNYALTYQYYRLNEDGSIPSGAKKIDGDEAFYRIAAGGASSKGNQGYLPLLTLKVKSTETVQGAKYGYTFVFEDLAEIPTEVLAPETSDSSERMENNVFYNLNGQKLNGLPTKSGLYIMNGKKVIIK